MVLNTIIASAITNTMGKTQRTLVRDSNGLIHVVFATPGGAPFSVYHRSSSDGGVTWSASHTIATSLNSAQAPVIAVDSSDNLHCIYMQWDGAMYDIEHRISADAGVTWGGATTVWDASALGVTMYRPSADIDSSDMIHCCSHRSIAGVNRVVYKNYTAGGGWSAEDNPVNPIRHMQNSCVTVGLDDIVRMICEAEVNLGRYNMYYYTYTVGVGWSVALQLDNYPLFNTSDGGILANSSNEYFYCHSYQHAGVATVMRCSNKVGRATYTGPADFKTRRYGTVVVDRDDNVYMFYINSTDAQFEYVLYDYLTDTWGAIVPYGAYGGLQQASMGITHNHPGGGTQGIPPSGAEAFGVHCGDTTVGWLYAGQATWPSGGAVSPHPALKRPATLTPIGGAYPTGDKY